MAAQRLQEKRGNYLQLHRKIKEKAKKRKEEKNMSLRK